MRRDRRREALFLASDEASFVNGIELAVDGDVGPDKIIVL
jgi:hypothetical protein